MLPVPWFGDESVTSLVLGVDIDIRSEPKLDETFALGIGGIAHPTAIQG
jgi:hypothetical protein